MFKSKKSYSILAVTLILMLLVVGCGGQKPGDSKPAEDKVYTVKIGYENHPGEPIHDGVEKWKQIAEEKSNGRLKVEIYPSSQLGTKKDAFEQMSLGANVIYIADASFLMDYVPDIGILTAPYLADSYDDYYRLFDSEWFKGLEKELNQKGYHIAGNWVYGDRHLLSTKPVHTPDDLRGQKIRVPGNRIAIATFEALGATPTPMPLGDVYPALQQGVVDGAENPLPVLYGSKQHEVAKNLSLTAHMNMIISWVAGQKFMDSLPAELATILKESAHEAGLYNNELVEKQTEETLAKFAAEGVNIIEVDKALFREKAVSMYDKISDWSPGLYDKVQEILKN